MTTRIAFLGDVLLGGAAQESLDREGYGYAFAGLAPLLTDVDLVVANHEGPLTWAGRPLQKAETGRKRYWYRADPTSARALTEAGVGVVSLANNHVLDFGVAGLADTIATLDAAGIGHCGAGRDEAEARRPVVVTVGGYRIGFLSVMQRYDLYVSERLYAARSRGGPLRLRLRQAREDLARLEGHVDMRVVLVHWGRNYRGVTRRQALLAAALREAGAELIIGHHPHIPQRVDLVDGRPVVFSLGNGPLGTPGRFHSGRPPYGLVSIVEVDAARFTRIELRLVAVDNAKVHFRPAPVRDMSGTRFLWSLVSADQGWQESNGGLWAELKRRH